tara:strand:- start:4017 stop:4865 length:849 start_codon:yes stop_codon:yes gene_type:complete
MKKYNNILVCGLGMMGSSLCKSIRKYNITKKISGLDLDTNTLKYAYKNKIVDDVYQDLNDMEHPDLVILCTPISTYPHLIKKILKTIKKKTILTDIGSSKGNLHSTIKKILINSKIQYLSCHPMVGSEKSGIRYHETDMYKDKIVFILNKDEVKKSICNKIFLFWKSIGSIPHYINKNKHDKLMAQTSHISHLMSYIFMDSLPQSVIDKNLPLLLGGGIKEHVRLSKSDPKMWSDIFINNRSNINESISRIEKNILRIKLLIKNSNDYNLEKYLKKIQSKTK